MNQEFSKRLKSFLWRLGVIVAIAVVNYIVENIAGFGLPLWAVGLIGLIGSEITKYLNKKHQLAKQTN